MRKSISILLSISLICVMFMVVGLIGSAKTTAPTIVHTFNETTNSNWSMDGASVCSVGIEVQNTGAYGCVKRNFAAKHMTTDGAACDITSYTNLPDALQLMVNNNGPATDLIVILYGSMGIWWKQTVSIPADFSGTLSLPLGDFVLLHDYSRADNGVSLTAGTTFQAFLDSYKTSLVYSDYFDLYEMQLNYASVDTTVSVDFYALDMVKGSTVYPWYTFTTDGWTVDTAASITEAQPAGLTVKNNTYGDFQNQPDFAATKYMTADGTRCNISTFENLADVVTLELANYGPTVDMYFYIQSAMGMMWKYNLNIPAGFNGTLEMPLKDFTFWNYEEGNQWRGRIAKDTTMAAFIADPTANNVLVDDFDIYKVEMTFVSTDPSVLVNFRSIGMAAEEKPSTTESTSTTTTTTTATTTGSTTVTTSTTGSTSTTTTPTTTTTTGSTTVTTSTTATTAEDTKVTTSTTQSTTVPGPTTVIKEETINDFSGFDNWVVGQGGTKEKDGAALVLKNSGGAYAYIENKEDFKNAFVLTTDGKTWDGNNGIDSIRVYIKNSSAAAALRLYFIDETGLIWIQEVWVEGNSDEFVAYDFKMADFHKGNMEGELRKNCELTASAFVPWAMALNIVSVNPADEMTFSRIVKSYEIIAATTGTTGTTAPVPVEKEKVIHMFGSLQNWKVIQGGTTEIKNGSLLLKNTGGTYAAMENTEDFSGKILLTKNGKAWDGNNGIDAIRVYIKNPGAESGLRLYFFTTDGTLWIQEITVAGGSDEFVPYDFKMAAFHKNNMEGALRSELAEDLVAADFAPNLVALNLVNTDTNSQMAFSSIAKVYQALENEDALSPDSGESHLVPLMLSVMLLSAACIVLFVAFGQKQRT